MNKITFMLSMFFCVNSYSQNLKFNLLKKNDLLNFAPSMNIYSGATIGSFEKPLVQLKNGDKINHYVIDKITIQNVTPNRYNSINLLAGYKDNKMIMSIDNNHNSIFSDDPVYIYTVNKNIITSKQFRDSLPLIKIDSLEILDKNGAKHYYSTNIHFCPTLKSDSSSLPFVDMPKFNNLGLLIFNDSSYFTKEFIIENKTYHIEVIPNALTFPVYPIDNSNYSSAFIYLIEHLKSDSFRLSGFQVIEFMIAKDRALEFDGLSLKVLKYDIKSKNIEVEIVHSKDRININAQELSNHKYYSLSEMKTTPISFNHKKYSVIEFSGSWCKPCNEIIPQIEKFQKGIMDTINFITVFKESNLKNASAYYKKIKPSWNTFFEPLNCNSAECLSKLFDIGIYPTLLLIDNKGEVLFKAIGSDCVINLESFLKKLK